MHSISDYGEIYYNGTQMQNALYLYGPLVAYVSASSAKFQMYGGGIFESSDSEQTALDHAILIVGYGFDIFRLKKYWIVKNSWGTSWGEVNFTLNAFLLVCFELLIIY